ncbi:MAG: class II aldolase/adducin family protein [Actinobacteria bacterium]|nr:class II aldolase/adducin family protein [Actinomycetota bacterium]
MPETPTSGSVDAALPLYYEIPRFETLEDERRHRQERLAAAFRIFGKFGFSEGVAGHITARDPEHTDAFWVNAFGQPFCDIRVSDLLLVSHTGDTLHGSHAVNQAAFAIHSGIHMARPDVIAAAHSHSLHGKAWSSLGRMLDPITQDSCIFYDNHVLFDDYTGVVNDPEEGKRIAYALAGHGAAILRNHGLLTVGRSVDEATWLFVSMERTCQAQLLAEAAGTPVLMDEAVAAETSSLVGSGFAGWFSAQPMFDQVIREQPDLLE